jgi:hypothetical protein
MQVESCTVRNYLWDNKEQKLKLKLVIKPMVMQGGKLEVWIWWTYKRF